MDNLTALAIVALVLVGVWLWTRPGRAGSRQAEKQLLRICADPMPTSPSERPFGGY